MQGGNPAAVAAGRVDCRRIRDGVDGSDNEQQANQPNDTLEFQSNLELVVNITLVSM
jgi:hypothetical protein